MKAGKWLLIVWLATLPAVASVAAAEDSGSKWSVGLRAAISAKRTDHEVFHIYEAVTEYALPQTYRWSSGWGLRSAVSAHVGLMSAGGENGLIVAVGPNAKLDLPGGIFFLTAGARAGVMSRHTFGNADLGGAFTFETDVGLSVNLAEGLSAGYRWQHLSNANVYDENPSVNLHAIDVTYRF